MMTRSSQLVEQYVQPILQVLSVQTREQGQVLVNEQAIADKIGMDIAHKIRQFSDSIVEDVAVELLELVQVQRRLHTIAKTMFPGETIIYFAPVEVPGGDAVPPRERQGAESANG